MPDGVEVLEHQTDPTFADDDGRGELEEGALVRAWAAMDKSIGGDLFYSSALVADA